MTPEQADARIILSRKTLHRYKAMIDAGTIPRADAGIVGDEIAELEKIAQLVSSKAEKIARLVNNWREVRAALVGKLH